MGKLTLITLILTCLANLSFANTEDLRTSEQAVAFANRLMIDISRGKIQQAWRKVKENSIIPPERVEAFAADYDRHLNQTIQYLGQPLGVELVAEEAFGRSLLRVTYLMKYNVSGIAWYIYFYKINDRWAVSEFNFDLNSNTLFSKINLTKGEFNPVTIQAWQEMVEQKLAEMESQMSKRSSTAIDPAALASISQDDAGALKILDLEARIVQLESGLSNYNALDTRLQALETKLGSVSQKFDAITYQLDLQELVSIRKTMEVLKNQHPYTEFP